MENLNKENFWNALHTKYPQAVDKFCKWIDEYKKEVGWDAFFANEGFTEEMTGMPPTETTTIIVGPRSPQIKFHHIPIEWQYGILQRFFGEEGLESNWELNSPGDVKKSFSELDSIL